MSIRARVYEVRVKVGRKLKSFHFRTNSQGQAVSRGEKHGRVVSVQKVNKYDLLGNIENLSLDDVSIGDYIGGELDRLKIDEALGLRKKESKNRRSKRGKERRDID